MLLFLYIPAIKVINGKAQIQDSHINQVLVAEEKIKNKIKKWMQSPEMEPFVLREVDIKAVSKILISENELVYQDQQEQELWSYASVKVIPKLQEMLPPYFSKKIKYKKDMLVEQEWATYYHTLNNPLSIMEDLLSGVLTTKQVLLLKEVFPAIYDVYNTACVSALLEVTDAEGENDIVYKKRKQIGILLQQPELPFNLFELIQQLKEEQGEKKTGGRLKLGKLTTESLTPTQRMENK